MHIEVGIIDAARVTAANIAAAGVVATSLRAVILRPDRIVKTVLAASVFSVLMEAWHLPVGPSELHLIGATTVYLLFGFAPTIVGFGLGLLAQALLFEPRDMLHLGVNALSLMLPMIATHYGFGRRLLQGDPAARFNLARVLRLDAIYYAGVSAMVGFWLLISGDVVAVADWGRWVLAYLPVFLAEALMTFTMVSLIARLRGQGLIARFTEVGNLRLAR
jgi:ABC-type Co2+ transport system permease subunit